MIGYSIDAVGGVMVNTRWISSLDAADTAGRLTAAFPTFAGSRDDELT
jgi:hypothetical protein